ncbi:putative alcohol oxidase [Xylariomycetidae sp. FL2044]|nr:putative alcohol oxidase [Xylariomycetidae sp. FL2044]
MPLYTKLPDERNEVDIMIAGGGTAACVVAARIADAYPDLSVLVVEGGSNNEMPTIEHPAFFLSHLAPDSKTNTFYMAKRSAAVADRRLIPAAAGSADDMLPYLKKLETYHAEDEKGVHGTEGPIHMSAGMYTSRRIQKECIEAAKKLGWHEVQDVQNLDVINSVGRASCFISPDGKRSDAASGYLHPRLRDGKHENLHVLVESQIRANPLFHPEARDLPPRSVKARLQVIASCGACSTPSLLERSGIGRANILDRAGVPVVADIPGVGNGCEDHHYLSSAYLNTLSLNDTLDGLVFGRMGPYENLIRNREKMLGYNGQEIQGKVRPTDAECLPRTRSRAGTSHITGPGLDDPVDFETGFFTDRDQLDIKKHVWAYKKQRELVRRMSSYRGERADLHPPFAADSAAACVEFRDGGLLPDYVADIVYTADDEAVLEKWLRENVGTTRHSLGTCKMLPREEGGVIDANLNVIAPRNVGANTNNTTLAVGEKAADIIITESGLRG